MAKIGKQTLEDFLEALASKAPTPGGGGAAAVAGALAAALASMCGNLTLGKEKYAAVEEEAARLTAEAGALRERFLRLADEDAAAFAGFMAVYKLPKSTEEEKAKRQQAGREAAANAAKVPLAMAEAAKDCALIAARMAVIGNRQLLSDAVCAALLAKAAFSCAEINVEVNLPFTEDAKLNEEMLASLTAWEGETEDAAVACMNEWQEG